MKSIFLILFSIYFLMQQCNSAAIDDTATINAVVTENSDVTEHDIVTHLVAEDEVLTPEETTEIEEAGKITENDLEVEWVGFKNKQRRKFTTGVEDQNRRAIFRQNLRYIRMHNARFRRKKVGFPLRLNFFADLTPEEKRNRYGGRLSRPLRRRPHPHVPKPEDKKDETLPSYVNWVEKGFNTPVMNQGSCASCYTQAVAAAIESNWFLKHNETIKLSEQELLDCTLDVGNNKGCQFGDLETTYRYIMEHGVGISENNPYKGRILECKKDNPRYKISEFKQTEAEDEEDLKRAVAKGPVAAVVSAGLLSFSFYGQGQSELVYSDKRCIIDVNSVNHFVLVVGYGTTDEGEDYWLLKNSWGTEWGKDGYMYMARNRGNMCGIATEAMYPIL